MLNAAIEEWHPNTVTVQPGSKTNFYFIPITGLQKGTHFRDVWLHIKKFVKRLEHIEIYPHSSEGWICVHRYVNFIKVMGALSQPLHVNATGVSSMICSSGQNKDGRIIIRIPIKCSQHVLTVINHAQSCKCLRPRRQLVKKQQTAISQPPSTPPCMPVIANGTYDPVKASESCNSSDNTTQSDISTPKTSPISRFSSNWNTPITEPPYSGHPAYQRKAYVTAWRPAILDWTYGQAPGPGLAYSAYEPSPAVLPIYWHDGYQFFDNGAYVSPEWCYWNPSPYSYMPR
ncbi:hypothetical protein F5X98DRAFT_372401 [Xylaria grammica]|nr:hypothetical protein F5X98DRAFT_372401 [Xylaria grammica]